MKREITVGVTTHGNRCEWLRDMLNSLYYFSKISFKLVIVDNASIDNTLEYLSELSLQMKDLVVIKNKVNVDDSIGMNQILEIIDTPYFLKIDTDTLFTNNGSVEKALRCLKTQRLSIVGPYWDLSLRRRKEINSWNHSQKMKMEFDRADNLVSKINHHFEVTVRLPRGNFMFLNTDDFREIGGFDQNYHHNAMEYSLVMRLIEKGLDYGEYNDERVIHRPSDEIRLSIRKSIPDFLEFKASLRKK